MSSTGSNSQTRNRSHVLLDEVESGLRKEELVFRVIHFWEARNPTKVGLLMGLELLLIDEQATVIQGFIAPNRMARYDDVLKRNSIYRLKNFYATRNKDLFRVTDHKFTICFTDLSSLTELSQEVYSIDAQTFRFHSFEEFESKSDMRGDLYYVIGQLKIINGQSIHQRPVLDGHEKDRVSVHLQPKEGPIINVYLWDNAATEFRKKFQASETTPVVLLVTTVNPKRLGGKTSLTSMSSSRVFFDSDVAATKEYLTWLGDNASNVATVNTSQITKLETLTIDEIYDFLKTGPAQVASFSCIATIDNLHPEHGWYYISCSECNTKVTRGATSLLCQKCKNENAIGVIKYRVEFSVHDNHNNATFVFLDRAATQLAGREAADIMDNFMEGDGGMPRANDVPVPQFLFDAIGQTKNFEVKVTPYNFTATRQTISVIKIIEAAELPKQTPTNNNVEVPEIINDNNNKKIVLQEGHEESSENTTNKRLRKNP